MKKIFFGVLLATISLITWLSIRQPVVVNAQESGCAINFTAFDIKVYDPKIVDSILFQNKLIADQTLFFKAIETDQLPFKTLPADESILQQTIDMINKDVCGGKCDEKALAMASTCADQISCFIDFTAFDPKTYDKAGADKILESSGLLNKGDFEAAIDKYIFPIKTKSGDKKIVDQAMNEIIFSICKGQCQIGSLSMFSVCSDSLLVSPAQNINLDRIANMSLCQKDVFDSMQLKNNDYLEAAKKNNSAYYLAMAPITNTFRRDYFATNDKGQRKVILDKYRLDNSLLRKELYKDQAEVLGKFIVDINTLSKTFAECK